jgi:hypothetical protein
MRIVAVFDDVIQRGQYQFAYIKIITPPQISGRIGHDPVQGLAHIQGGRQ